MKKSIRSLSLIIIAIVIAIGINIAFAVWSGPLQNPPEGNVPAPINTSSNTQTLQGSKTINGSNINDILTFGLGVGFNSILGVNGIAQFFSTPISAIFDGNVGIGVTNPQAKLDVAGDIKVNGNIDAIGSIKIGNTTNSVAGAIRFTGTDFEGYTGTEWVSLTSGDAVADTGLPFYGTNNESESIARKEECISTGGTVTDYQANSFCKFQTSSCSGGWIRYENLGSTSSNSCTGSYPDINPCSITSCTTANHNFANIPTETCSHTGTGNDYYGCYQLTCFANIIEVGCY